MNRVLNKITCLILLACLISCEKSKAYPWDDSWGDNTEQEQQKPDEEKPDDGKPDRPVDPDQPVVPDTPDQPDIPTFKGKPRYVWIDAGANFRFYANSRKAIADDMARLAQIGFTDIILDVRPSTTGVLFKSKTEPELRRVPAWVNGTYQWVNRTEDFDYLSAFIEEGHKYGLRVNASINTFVGGYILNYNLGKVGMLFEHPERKDWATVINALEGLTNVMDQNSPGPKFLNPASDDAVNYLLDLLSDLASYKDLDGIVLDRCRYDDHNLLSDFSDISRKKFEDHIGKKISSFPHDIMNPGQKDLDAYPSNIQKQWLEFRAKNIHDFVEKASQTVHKVNPKIRFGAYVGGWYSTYYHSGVNWASPKYNPRTEGGYNWATNDYAKYGYADHCDFMFIGAYASTSNIWGSREWTMEGFCKQAKKLFKGDVLFAGGPDIGNSKGFENGGCGYLMPDIVKACITPSDGIFFFDLCHIRMYNYWDDINRAFNEYLASIK